MPSPTRAVAEYRLPGTSLLAGEHCTGRRGRLAQGAVGAHTPPRLPDRRRRGSADRVIGDWYVVARLTDVAPVDSPVYFSGARTLTSGDHTSIDHCAALRPQWRLKGRLLDMEPDRSVSHHARVLSCTFHASVAFQRPVGTPPSDRSPCRCFHDRTHRRAKSHCTQPPPVDEVEAPRCSNHSAPCKGFRWAHGCGTM